MSGPTDRTNNPNNAPNLPNDTSTPGKRPRGNPQFRRREAERPAERLAPQSPATHLPAPTAPDGVRIRDAVRDFLHEKRVLAETTHRWYASFLRLFAEWCEANGASTCDALTGTVLLDWQASLFERLDARTGKPVGSHSIRAHVVSVRTFLKWCAAEGLCQESLLRRLHQPRLPKRVIRTFNHDHIRALLSGCDVDATQPWDRWMEQRNRAIILVLLGAGIRADELCTLTLDRVRLDDDQPYLLVRGKGNKDREVALPPQAMIELRRYLRARPKHAETDRVFVGQKRKPMTPNGIDQILYRIRDYVGAEKFATVRVSAHTFRHTFAKTYLEMPGADLFKLKETLGHTDIQTTQIYLRDFNARHARKQAPYPLDHLL